MKTPLYELSAAHGARFIDFGGWDLPVSFGSQIEEHHAVRRDAGVFDVSHMGIVDLAGPRTRELLRHLLANDVARLEAPGRALYSCLLAPGGGILDDLIAYRLPGDAFRLVVNAGTRGKDVAWIREHAARLGVLVHERTDLAMLAVQGPRAIERTLPLLPAHSRAAVAQLARFGGTACGEWFVARTGYTGEDGLEIMLPVSDAPLLWQALIASGVRPIGLGARDTLRLEAGLSLYGNDLDEQHHPLESGLAWTVAFEPQERDFIGRSALEAIRHRDEHAVLVGLVLEERGVLRSHQRIFAQAVTPAAAAAARAAARSQCGEVTSGTFSPTLNRSIALARVARGVGETVEVDIRGTLHRARIVKPPFVRAGRILIDLTQSKEIA